MCFPPAGLAADAWGVPYRRRLVNCQCRRCLAGARWGFRRDCEKHRTGCHGRGQQRKRRARGELHRDGLTQTAGYRYPRVCRSHHFVWRPDLGSGVVPASYHGGGDFACRIFCLIAMTCPLCGDGSFVLANAGTPHCCQRVVRGLGSNSRSR